MNAPTRPKKNIIPRCALAVLLAVFQYAWAWFWTRRLMAAGMLLSARDAARAWPLAPLLHLLLCLPALAVLPGALALWGRAALDRLMLRGGKGWGAHAVRISAAVYLAELVYALLRLPDRAAVLYQWVYYLLMIAFCEEAVFRGLLPALLSASPKASWVLPAALFALSHTLVPLIKGTLSVQSAWGFLRDDMLGFMAFACLMELYKRKTGTLLAPVLLHAGLDFLNVFQ